MWIRALPNFGSNCSCQDPNDKGKRKRNKNRTMAKKIATVKHPIQLFADVDELSPDDYEPCTRFSQINFEVTEFNKPVDATVNLTKDQNTQDGRPRTRLIIEKKKKK